MKYITLNNIFAVLILAYGFFVNSSLMLAMITSLIICIIFFVIATGGDLYNNLNNITDLQTFMNDEDLIKKTDELLFICGCMFVTFTTILYNIILNITV